MLKASQLTTGRATAGDLIIDDIDASIAWLSDLGTEVVGPVARKVRSSVLLFAAVHAWPVVSHGAFANWLAAISTDDKPTLVLDPLVPASVLGRNAVKLRFSRYATPLGLRLDGEIPEHARPVLQGRRVRVIDDAAASGMTLTCVKDRLAGIEASVSELVLLSLSQSARVCLCAWSPSPSLSAFAQGNLVAYHLRDVCPFLPFAGKQVGQSLLFEEGSASIAVAAPVTAFRGGPWSTLALDSNLRFTIRMAHREIIDRFSAALGRPAVVEDLPRLGVSIRLPVLSPRPVALHVPLAALTA